MPRAAVICGAILVVIGLIGYLYGVSVGSGSPTALIPSVIGVIIAILGIAAQRNEGPRRHLMHGALFVALLGAGAVLGRLISKGSISANAPDLSMLATALVCILFIVLGVRSFVAARSSSNSG
jgi:hypothetical protein